MELNAATRLVASKYAMSTEEQAAVLQRIANSWPYDMTRKAAIEAALKGEANPKQIALIIETLQRCVTNLKGNARDEAKKALRERT
jgi:hypothetical protein